WDFSNVTPLDTETLAYLNPKETPYYYKFSDATIAMTSDKVNYQYFYFDSTHYSVVGGMGIQMKYDVFEIETFDKPEVMLKYPIEFRDTFSFNNVRLVNYP